MAKTKQTESAPAGKVGVYVCHCGGNISDEVDVEQVCARARKVPGVVVARANVFMCSDPGQEMIIEDLKSGLVDRVVVASCSPSLHETTFRQALVRAGVNPYVYEHANLREQVSWVHHGAEATDKASRLVAAAAAKAARLESLYAHQGGGGAQGVGHRRRRGRPQGRPGVGRAGHAVVLVEKSPFLGGQVAQLDRLAPTGEAAAGHHERTGRRGLQNPLIKVPTCAELEDFDGYIGNFKIKLEKAARRRRLR